MMGLAEGGGGDKLRNNKSDVEKPKDTLIAGGSRIESGERKKK